MSARSSRIASCWAAASFVARSTSSFGIGPQPLRRLPAHDGGAPACVRLLALAGGFGRGGQRQLQLVQHRNPAVQAAISLSGSSDSENSGSGISGDAKFAAHAGAAGTLCRELLGCLVPGLAQRFQQLDALAGPRGIAVDVRVHHRVQRVGVERLQALSPSHTSVFSEDISSDTMACAWIRFSDATDHC